MKKESREKTTSLAVLGIVRGCSPSFSLCISSLCVWQVITCRRGVVEVEPFPTKCKNYSWSELLILVLCKCAFVQWASARVQRYTVSVLCYYSQRISKENRRVMPHRSSLLLLAWPIYFIRVTIYHLRPRPYPKILAEVTIYPGGRGEVAYS